MKRPSQRAAFAAVDAQARGITTRDDDAHEFTVARAPGSGVDGALVMDLDADIAVAPKACRAPRGAEWSTPPGGGRRAGPAANRQPELEIPRVSVIIPALNEEKNLPLVLPAIPSWVDEVLLVDGRSTDRSVEVARRLWPDIRVIFQPGKGKGDALRAGFEAARGDIIVTLDADGSTDPARFLPSSARCWRGRLREGVAFHAGGRHGRHAVGPPRGHGMLVQLVRTAFGCNFSDLCYGYNAFWVHHLPRLDLDADGFEIETLMNLRALRPI